MTSQFHTENCPVCQRPAVIWVEKPAHGSRELYWIGCRKDGLLEGGTREGAAVQNWNRRVADWRHHHTSI